MSEEKKVLNEEELEDAAGGDRTIDGYHFYGHVGKYDGVVGKSYYVTDDGGNGYWFSGTLLKTWEKSWGCNSRRTHQFQVGIAHHWKRGTYTCDIIEVCGDDVTLWENCDFPPGVYH